MLVTMDLDLVQFYLNRGALLLLDLWHMAAGLALNRPGDIAISLGTSDTVSSFNPGKCMSILSLIPWQFRQTIVESSEVNN